MKILKLHLSEETCLSIERWDFKNLGKWTLRGQGEGGGLQLIVLYLHNQWFRNNAFDLQVMKLT